MSRIVVMRAKAERLEIEPVRLNESGPHRASGWKPEVWRLQIHPRIGSFLEDRIKFLYVNLSEELVEWMGCWLRSTGRVEPS